MCVRTKTSNGCGHVFKDTVQCDDRVCAGLKKFHFQNGLDCQKCKALGATETRGRDGGGKYGRKLARRSDPVTSPPFVDHDPFDDAEATEGLQRVADGTPSRSPRGEINVSGGATPWALPRAVEKSWHTRTRRKADSAWESEHADRIDALTKIAKRCTLSDYPPSPRRDREMEEPDYYAAPTPYSLTPARSSSQSKFLTPLSSRSRSSRQNQDRQDSYDSLPESMQSYISSPQPKYSSVKYAYAPQQWDYRDVHSTPITNSYHPETPRGRRRSTSWTIDPGATKSLSRLGGHGDGAYGTTPSYDMDAFYGFGSPKYRASQEPPSSYRYSVTRRQSYVNYHPEY